MGYYQVRGFPLEHTDIKENEVLITVFSLEQGKIRVCAKGTKKAASTLRPALLPLVEGSFYITERRTSDLLTEWVPLRDYSEACKKTGRVGLAGYIARYFLVLLPGREPDSRLYNLLENIYLLFNTRMEHDIIRVLFEWGFLRALGTKPSLRGCAACGNEFADVPIVWDIPDGGLYCAACAAGQSPGTRASLSLKSAVYGKNIDRVSESLVRDTIDPSDRALEDNLMVLEKTEKSHRAQFAGAVTRFCMYHLNEEIADWHINTK